ncbi:RnfH family protein [Pseudomonas sp. ABC1]|uniref:RnfH family protein n=1 Tax=Pseudomonas sp. ABC1 TaxID=2748080 RepID=UPI0015C3B762|nr:RnfH family protein [Pseudomonas sp. ABC1]QLF94135.1 RnfH family protein [Pseudomonas sp. ABC1]
MAEPGIEVEVVYALADQQRLVSIRLPEGASVRDAAVRSGLDASFPGLDLLNAPLGLFGKRVAEPEKRLLSKGDRVEIYRPLLADPKEVRKLRAARAKERAGQS